MKIEPINSKEQHQEYLKRFNEIFDAEGGSENSDESDLLALVIEKYEDEHYPIKELSKSTREGWEEKFKNANSKEDKELLLPDVFDDEKLENF